MTYTPTRNQPPASVFTDWALEEVRPDEDWDVVDPDPTSEPLGWVIKTNDLWFAWNRFSNEDSEASTQEEALALVGFIRRQEPEPYVW